MNRTNQPDPDDVGLRFDASVPVETIVVEDPEVARLGPEAFVQITEKHSYKLDKPLEPFWEALQSLVTPCGPQWSISKPQGSGTAFWVPLEVSRTTLRLLAKLLVQWQFR